MSTISIKDRIIEQIESIQDEDFLNELEGIIINLSKDNSNILILPDEMRETISRSELDIANNRVKSNDDAMQHLKEWLKNK